MPVGLRVASASQSEQGRQQLCGGTAVRSFSASSENAKPVSGSAIRTQTCVESAFCCPQYRTVRYFGQFRRCNFSTRREHTAFCAIGSVARCDGPQAVGQARCHQKCNQEADFHRGPRIRVRSTNGSLCCSFTLRVRQIAFSQREF